MGTPYPEVVAEVRRLLQTPVLSGSVLSIDQTGVGRAVVDMLVEALQGVDCDIHPIVITGGHAATVDAMSSIRVPKRELVGTMQVLLQTRRLRIARQLADRAALVQELGNFGVQITAARHEVFAARAGQHDDLLMAVSLAAWVGEKMVSTEEVDEPRDTVFMVA